MNYSQISTFVGLVMSFCFANAAPNSFVYEGLLLDSAGTPIVSSSTVAFRIYDPVMSCLLYEEELSLTPAADGSFSVLVGSSVGATKRTSADPGLSMESIFATSGEIRATGSANCSAGYTPASTDQRKFVVAVNGVTLTPAIDLTAAPFAINSGRSEKVGTYDPTKLLRTDGAVSVPALDDAKVTLLMSILSGTLGAPSASNDLVTKAYLGSLATLSPTGTADATTFLRGDGTWSTVTGGGVTSLNGKTGAVVLASGDIPALDASQITTGTITRDINATTVAGGTGSFSNLKIYDGASQYLNFSFPAGGTGYTLSWPNAAGANGDVLQVNGAGQLSWATLPSAPVTTVAGRTGNVTLTNADIAGLGTAATKDVGSGANNVVQLDASSKLPAVDGSALTNITTSVDKIISVAAKYFDYKPNGVACANGETLRYITGTGWTCADANAGSVTSVFAAGTAGNPIVVSGTASAPEIDISAATASTNGYLKSTDWTTFNNKQASSAELTGISNLVTTGLVQRNGAGSYTALAITPPLMGNGVSLNISQAGPASNGFLSMLDWNTFNDKIDASTLNMVQATPCKPFQTMIWVSATQEFQCFDSKPKDVARITSAPMTIYVSNLGNDITCDGTSGCPYATLQKALDEIPHILKHNVTIKISSNLSVSLTSMPMAVINKSITASDEISGPLLVIEGNGSLYTLTNSALGGRGLLISKQSRGVILRNLAFNGFEDEALEINGAVVLADSTNFSNNGTAARVSSAGQLNFVGSSSTITLRSALQRSTGIEISDASTVRVEANLMIQLGTYQDNRGVTVESGQFSVESAASVNFSAGGSSSYIVGLEVSDMGRAYADQGATLMFNMNGGMNAHAIRIRGGSLDSNGSLEISNLAANGLLCENGASCDLYGMFKIISSNFPSNRPVEIANNSTLMSSHDFLINTGASMAAVSVRNGSVFTYNAQSPSRSFNISGGGSGSSAIAVSNGSRFLLEQGMYSVNAIFSGADNILLVTDGSYAAINSSSVGGTIGGSVRVDADSAYKTLSSSFPAMQRSCDGSQTSVGSGPGAFCVESTDNSAANYNFAVTNCGGKGMRLCSINQYINYCSLKSASIGNHWSAEGSVVNCTGAGSAGSSYTTLTNSQAFRCCK